MEALPDFLQLSDINYRRLSHHLTGHCFPQVSETSALGTGMYVCPLWTTVHGSPKLYMAHNYKNSTSRAQLPYLKLFRYTLSQKADQQTVQKGRVKERSNSQTKHFIILLSFSLSPTRADLESCVCWPAGQK